MFYIIKFILKLLLVVFIWVIFSIFCFFELIFMFSQKRTDLFWDFLNTIYHRNSKLLETNRKIAKNATLLTWLIDYKNQYHLFENEDKSFY